MYENFTSTEFKIMDNSPKSSYTIYKSRDNMKSLKLVCLFVFGFFAFDLAVEARTYTNVDVESHLSITMANVNEAFGENISYTLKDGTITFKKTTKDNQIYTSVFTYNNGKYTFSTTLSNVVSLNDHLQNFYDFLAATTTASAILAIYDEDTANEVKDLVVSNELDNDHLSKETHGIVWIDSPITPMAFVTDMGKTFSIDGSLKTIEIDLNNKKFMKLATTIEEEGNNPLEQILLIVEGGDTSTGGSSSGSGSENIETGSGSTGTSSGNTPFGSSSSSGNTGTTTGGSSSPSSETGTTKPSTNPETTNPDNSSSSNNQNTIIQNGNNSYESENVTHPEKGENTSSGNVENPENPKTGVYTSLTGIIILVVCLILFNVLNKKKLFKNF